MTDDDLLAFFDKPIAFHPGFVKLTGSVNAALMLSQAFYWQKRAKSEDGSFYKSQDEWTKEIYLTRREQEGARKLLRATGFWFEVRKGNPAKMYYRLDMQAFRKAIAGKSSVQTSMAESAIHESTNAPTKNGGKSHTPRARPSDQSESTTENTSIAQALRAARLSDIRMLLSYLSFKSQGAVPNNGQQASAIKWLLDHGYEVQQCKACLDFLFKQEWRTTAPSWSTVQKEIAVWLQKQNGSLQNRSSKGTGKDDFQFQTTGRTIE